ncbi:MAG: hypothetical protein V1659_02015, partial [Candidatus Woesearchaeota archaeon]
FFVLNVSDGEEISEISPSFKKKILVSKPVMPAMPIENYEHQGIVIKYEPTTWIDKLNSIVIYCERIENIKELNHVFEKAIAVVNDAVCLENFEKIIEKNEDEEIVKFFEKISQESEEYRKMVCCTINISDIKKPGFKEIIDRVVEPKNKHLSFVYSLSTDELQEEFGALTDIISIYIKKKLTLYLKNKRLQKSPYFIGIAGPYRLSEKEAHEQSCLSIACTQSSLIVDVKKFYSIYGLDTEKFSQLMFNISKSFLSANSLQRRKSQEYFKEIISIDKKNEKEFLEVSRNCIRFWNYGLLEPGIDSKHVFNMISEAKKKVNQFCIAEETIYKSCGMPTRFKIALACAFREADSRLSTAKYNRLKITSIEDLYNQKIKKDIIEKEMVTEMFNGGNDVTFHRHGTVTPDEIVREISVIMNTYKLPLFSYCFEETGGNMRITSYFST